MMDLIYQVFPLALLSATPLIIGALGGFYSERSGIVNIAVDGTMQIGAFVAAVTLLICEASGVGAAGKWIALVMAMVAGALFISIHAIASIHFRADQTISGTALNVLAGGLTIYLCQILYNARQTHYYAGTSTFVRTPIPFLKDIPIIGRLFFTNLYPTTYVAFALVVITWFVVYKTPFGLRLRSCGEYPQASASMGINVVKMRWIGVLISGALSGLAGAVLVFTTSSYFYGGTVNGLGFVAIATLIFGQWNPWGILFAGIFFGFTQVLGMFSNSIPLLSGMPSEFYSLFPYVMTIVALVLFSGKNGAPKASGEIYDAGKR